MRILFISGTRIGDAVLSTGVLSHLVSQYRDARVTVAAGEVAIPIFEAVPGIERLIAVRKEPFGRHWFKLWRACVGQRWDIVVDIRRSIIGWTLLTNRRYVLPRKTASLHRVELMAATFGLQSDPPAPTIWTNARHAASAAALIPDRAAVLAMAPAANWLGKEWRAERFSELAMRLTAPGGILPGAHIAIFAAPNEQRQAETVLAAVPPERRIDTVGRIDLPTIAACLRRCAFFVGNDSGLMHMAAASGTPTLGLFGPSREEHYAPWGPRAAWVRTAKSLEELTGAPNYDYRTTNTLMDSLSVDMAEQAARRLWKRIEMDAA
jgi:heptosyltransferase-3